jgi:hypothetical protein
LIGRKVSGILKCVKEGLEFEIAVQKSWDFRMRALQGCLFEEKAVGPLLFDYLSSAIETPAKADEPEQRRSSVWCDHPRRFAQIAAFGQNMGEQDLSRQVND